MTDQSLVQVEAIKTTTGIILLTIYRKSEKVDIGADDIWSIITQYERLQISDREDF